MRKLVNILMAGGLALTMVAGASAADPEPATGNAQVEVTTNDEGEWMVQITQAPNFGTTPYSLQSTTLNPSVVWGDFIVVVTDERGGDNGWNVTLSGGDFKNGDETRTFPVTNLTIAGGDTIAAIGRAENVTESNVTVGAGVQNLLSATEAHDSNGIFTSTYTNNSLIVPAGTLVDTYTSTLTVTLASGPN